MGRNPITANLFRFLTDNTELFEKITSHVFKGTYHNQIGIILEEIAAASERRADYFNVQ